MIQSIIRFSEMNDYEAVERLMGQVHALHINWRPDIYKANAVILPHELFEKAVTNQSLAVAEADGKVVGSAIILRNHIENRNLVARDILLIDSMVIDAAYRGKGIGRQLFGFIKELAKRENVDGIELQVNAWNAPARRMYEKYGFTEKSIKMELPIMQRIP